MITPLEFESILERLEELEDRVRVLEMQLEDDDPLPYWEIDEDEDDDLLD